MSEKRISCGAAAMTTRLAAAYEGDGVLGLERPIDLRDFTHRFTARPGPRPK
jgi:hypothetical protein